tara:strand:+ start:566 stop:742 length:177 start_codon:yes stop_codon:yes gene_type:complete
LFGALFKGAAEKWFVCVVVYVSIMEKQQAYLGNPPRICVSWIRGGARRAFSTMHEAKE